MGREGHTRGHRRPDVSLMGEATCRPPPVGVGTPEFLVTVRVAPAAKPRLALLDERAPKLPLPSAVERDERDRARLGRRFDRTPTDIARDLLPFGPKTEVLDAPELTAETVTGLAAALETRYHSHCAVLVTGPRPLGGDRPTGTDQPKIG